MAPMCRTTSSASMVFPTVNGTPLSPHNYERRRDRAGGRPRRNHDRAAEATPERRPEARQGDRREFPSVPPNFATWMQRTGATVKDVQGVMWHSSPDQTLKAYMREIPAGVRTAVDALDRMLTEQRRL